MNTDAETIKQMREKFAKQREHYLNDPSTGRLRALIYGDFGSGKTTLCATARAPIHIDCFDAHGLESIRKEIESGRVIPARYDNEQSSNPKQYRQWERDYKERVASGYFNYIGTYVIDSGTWFLTAMMNQIVKDKSSKRPDGVPAIQDYMVQQIAIRDILMMTTTLPCDFIMTGHIDMVTEETGTVHTSLLAPRGLKVIIPTLFSEVWVTRVQQTPSGPQYRVLTQDDGIYRAETRIGTGVFERMEEPNIKNMLKKAGLPHEDLNLPSA